jgi:hypothetical protein
MTADNLVFLKSHLRTEMDAVDARASRLHSVVANNGPLTDDLLNGVTYGETGLGGCYGGLPFAEVVLDCIMQGEHHLIDLDTGSEVTDYADSAEKLFNVDGVEGQHATSSRKVAEAAEPKVGGIGADQEVGAAMEEQ